MIFKIGENMKIKTKPLIFKTLNSLYCYDDSTKNVFPINEIEKDFIEHIQPNQEFTADNPNLSAITNKIERLGLFQKNLISEIPIEDELRNYKLKNGITHLCLILTEACDFRCKYCIYSDNYFYTNSYSSKKMSFDVAKRAIDFYVNINMKAIRYNPNKRFTIGFYGGEPTLCHLTIMKIVEYIKVEYPFIWDNITFLITTNGYSLTEERSKFYLENKFSISVSLDGDKVNHDRNRVTVSGEGTFDRIIDNLTQLEKNYTNLKSNGSNVIDYGILVTFDSISDFDMLKKFFYENPNLDNRIQRVTRVSDVNTSYYDSNDQKISNQKRTEFLRTIIANVKRKKTNLSNFETIILKNILHEPLMLTQYTDNSMRGACIPGSYKLSVDVDGAFHMCEKRNPNYSIGSVYDGIDEDAQLDVMSNFFKEINKKCKNCNIKNLCNICYVSAETEKESFNISLEYCQKMREGVLSSLSEYYSLLESNPDLFMDLRR